MEVDAVRDFPCGAPHSLEFFSLEDNEEVAVAAERVTAFLQDVVHVLVDSFLGDAEFGGDDACGDADGAPGEDEFASARDFLLFLPGRRHDTPRGFACCLRFLNVLCCGLVRG